MKKNLKHNERSENVSLAEFQRSLFTQKQRRKHEFVSEKRPSKSLVKHYFYSILSEWLFHIDLDCCNVK